MNSSIKTYLESLPKKRIGSGCLFFDERGRVLLVKPTYQPGWQYPGGVVEQDESPRWCCQREVREELGIEREIGALLVVDYNDPADEKTEALMFIFDGGELSPAEIESIRLPRDELSEFGFFAPDSLPLDMTVTLRRRLLAAWGQLPGGGGVYLENQQLVSARDQ